MKLVGISCKKRFDIQELIYEMILMNVHIFVLDIYKKKYTLVVNGRLTLTIIRIKTTFKNKL